jgi:hypothetical protein
LPPGHCCPAFCRSQSLRAAFFLLALACLSLGLPAQAGSGIEKLLDRIAGDSLPPGKARLLAYPSVAYSPETSWELGAAAACLFYARGDYEHNRLNELTAFIFYTLRGQYGLWFDHAIYSDRDRWFLLGRERFQDFPLFYYGIGRDAEASPYSVVDARYVLLRERVLHRVAADLFAGFQLDYQALRRVRFEAADSSLGVLPLPLGGAGNRSLGLGLSLIYDTRQNYLNVREGWFAELGYLRYHPAWGSEYCFQTLLLDARHYRPGFGKGQVWAFQLTGQWVDGEAPFNQLALVGGEMLMRGYYLGRFRDRAYLAAQSEYRFLPFPFAKRWGAAFFAAGGLLADSPGGLLKARPLVSGGAGIRFLIFPQKDIFTRLDLGLTPEGSGFYLYLGESF